MVQGCSFFQFLFFSTVFLPLLLKFCENGRNAMNWDIVEKTKAPPFFTNSRVDTVGFVDPHKMVVRRSAFSTLSNAQNGGEPEGGAKSGRLKHQFSQVEGDLDL
jgi:hypothetical protein